MAILGWRENDMLIDIEMKLEDGRRLLTLSCVQPTVPLARMI
eukprot:COSAG02_NODE_4258_length_5577_cov_35.451625_2_plen_42_part_00